VPATVGGAAAELELGAAMRAAVALRALLIATACGLAFALLNLPLPDGRAGSTPPGESGIPLAARRLLLLVVVVLVAPCLAESSSA